MKYGALTLPVMFAVPEIFAPVPVTVNVVLPTAVITTFPFAVGILTLLLPLAIIDVAPELTVDQE